MSSKHDLFIVSNVQKVLNFMLDYPGREFMEKEICGKTKISKSGVNYAMRSLVKQGLVHIGRKGKLCFYTLNHKDPVIKQAKILKVVKNLRPVVGNLFKIAEKVILFGSASRGDDLADSDIDLLIITNADKTLVENILLKSDTGRKIQAHINSETGFAEKKKTDAYFYEQIMKGITLWQKE